MFAGCGYFLVTPDTYRLPNDNHQQVMPMSWQHYNQMYIPVLDQPRPQGKDISCQVSLVNQPVGQVQIQQHQQRILMEHIVQQQKLNLVDGKLYKGGSSACSAERSKTGSGCSNEIHRAGSEGSEVPSVQKPTRLCRSRSLPRYKEKEQENKNIRRSNSLKGDKRAPKDVNLANSNINKVKDKGKMVYRYTLSKEKKYDIECKYYRFRNFFNIV